MASSSYFRREVSLCRSTVAVVLLCLWSSQAFAKGPELSAIEVYPSANSQDYVQVAGFTLNGKNEMHLCNGEQKISKGSYGKLPKIVLAAGNSLERGQDGVLLLSRGGPPECVVPGNLKLEKAEGETPAELAERAILSGQIMAKSAGTLDSIPPFARGVKIFLVATLDTELAEFLRAQRAATIGSWRSYLAKYPSGPHAGEAKAALSVLYVQDGQATLAAYQASLKDSQPNYSKLQAANTALSSAIAIAPTNPSTDALAKSIQQETGALNSKGMSEIALFRSALASQVGGYSHLVAAEALSQLTLNLAPKSAETALLIQECTQERTNLDHRFVDSANKLAANRPDEAYAAIKPLRPFAQEYPRVQDCLNAIYNYHVAAAKKDAANSDPQGAVVEFKKAADIASNPEIAALVQTAEQQARESTDRAAVTAAVTTSTAAEEDKDYVKAYEVLDNLSSSQRKLVADRLDSLKERFVTQASTQARDLQRIHTPIKGLANEVGIQHAYNLLDRCYALTSDPSFDDRMKILGQSLSAYYLSRAKYYLDRPDGTGANVGWTYLAEALQYKGVDAETIRDEMTRATPAHQLRSTLSIKVEFRDQTSRRDAANFADQLTDSLASGLESSNFSIKVVRPKESPVVNPSFTLVGDVMQRTESNSLEKNAKSSKYRSGELEVANEDWNAANREYESANLALQTAQQVLEGAAARGKKGQISDAERQVAEATKKVKEAHVKLDSLPKTRSQEIERPYVYTEQINHLKAAVELQFMIKDIAGNTIVPPAPILETQEKAYTTLDNVKSEDTTGVRVEGEVPSETQFLEKVEYAAQDRLLKQAGEKVGALPALLLQNADHKAAEGDNDGAAEQYILYLDSIQSQDTPDRRRAQKFLADNFNFRAFGDTSPKG